MLNIGNESLRDWLVDLRNAYFPELKFLPYNRFELEKSQHFWLSPTTEKAAFRHPKFRLTQDDPWWESGEVFCGWNVEKGLSVDPALLQLPASNRMNSEWFWHRFLKWDGSQLFRLVQDARQQVDDSLEIFVTAGIPNGGKEWPRLLLDVNGAKLHRAKYVSADGTLNGLSGANDFAAFLRELNELTAAEWYWVDIVIGQTMSLDPSAKDDSGRIADMLSPFEESMRNTPK